MADKKQSQPNSPFDNKAAPTTAPPKPPQQPQSPPQNKTQTNQKPDFNNMVKRGINQFNAMPKEQKFTPPPTTAGVAKTPLPTQPKVPQQQPVVPEKKPLLTPIKILILFILLLIITLITVSATLVATDYQLYSPPEPIRNLLESLLS